MKIDVGMFATTGYCHHHIHLTSLVAFSSDPYIWYRDVVDNATML